jgi:hypothetical protein
MPPVRLHSKTWNNLYLIVKHISVHIYTVVWSRDKVKDEMGKGCSTKVGGRGMHVGYCWEIHKEGDHQENKDVGGWTVLK